MEAAKENSEQIQPLFAQPLRVTTFGIADKAVKAMEVAFKNYGNNCAVIVGEQQAEVGIFDFDDIESRRRWIKFKAGNRDAVHIILSSKDLDIPGAYIVTKPMRVGKFIAIFQDIRDKKPVPSNNSGNTPAQAIINAHRSAAEAVSPSPTPSPTPSHAVSNSPAAAAQTNDVNAANNLGIALYSPEKYLQTELSMVSKEAVEKDIVIEIQVNLNEQWESIFFYPHLKHVDTKMNEEQLKYICNTKLFCLETKTVRHSSKESESMEKARAGDSSLMSFESFLWKIALWTGGGRLPRSFDQAAYYQLRRWPNLSRVEKISGAMTMSALLMDKPIRLALFLKLTGLDPRNVAAFLTCAKEVGILKSVAADAKIETLDNAPTQAHPKTGIFQKILSTLKGKD